MCATERRSILVYDFNYIYSKFIILISNAIYFDMWGIKLMARISNTNSVFDLVLHCRQVN